MVVCQYFLKGDCRFGDRCRYEHPTAKKTSVCPHFLRGYCRFGDKCWNDHPKGSQGMGNFGNQPSFGRSSFGSYRQNNRREQTVWGSNKNRYEALSTVSGGQRGSIGGQHGRAVESSPTGSQIQQVVSQDIQAWEQGKQWPFSCYTYTKDEPCLNGLLDFSPEELRLEAYKANAEGSVEAYKQEMAKLVTSTQQRKLELGRMSASQIQEEVRSQRSLAMASSSPSMFQIPQQQSGTGPSLFSNSTTQSSGIFGGGIASNQSSAFLVNGNQTSQSQMIFGTGSFSNQLGPLFGSSVTTSQSSGFLGNGSVNNQSGGFLGQSSQTHQSGGLFGSHNPVGHSSGSFGTTANSLTTNQFSSSGFAAMATGQGFGASSSPQSKDFFGGENKQATGLFGSTLPTSIGGLFNSNTNQQANSGRVFGTQTNHNVSAITPATVAQSSSSKGQTLAGSANTGTLKCSEQDLQAFRADSFVLGQIPECPPPPELC